ncbi:MAG TPA: Clp protease [Proteus vulgaris]|uniref:ATP-dependent Clp protease proteolytic subunit 2 n=1 Tax=Proteus mirabilis TaxID=584 RepID=A0A379FGC1_PROMI|nr:ATP-dependent Clp protease proteolytic subunit [Proteus mirabilis]HCN41013.1 Clp protease [Proteus vulgaris]EEI47924.1 putative endopeptidase Clp [Proteus mirabilis ATCC 29906]MBI6412945.1 ATP-dependent Clp protease proteolytic subunit [Proteus mirabilis]SUC18956.1 ATP-dependent Clp protease proteolytic subunit 2 [Proteus mirabilis]HBC7459914.1 ATP-dependent Clp protease proteolytic subunit [Proteus mirabilis]
MVFVINFLCPVTQNTISQLQDRCLTAIANGATEIKIHISSQGGDIAAGFTAYNFLKSLPVNVTTHNISNVESIANIIYLAGSKRLINPMARFLLHPFHWGLGGLQSVDHERLREWVLSLDNDLERFINVMNTECSQQDWRGIIKASTIYNSSDAIELNIASEISDASIESTDKLLWVIC